MKSNIYNLKNKKEDGRCSSCERLLGIGEPIRAYRRAYKSWLVYCTDCQAKAKEAKLNEFTPVERSIGAEVIRRLDANRPEVSLDEAITGLYYKLTDAQKSVILTKMIELTESNLRRMA